MYATWKDAVAPTITFGTDGSNGKWIKTAKSKITVSDSGSGVDSTTFKYLFSTSKTISFPATGEKSFTSGGTYTLANKDGKYYLHAYACDKDGNCTTKVSKEFKLDNTPPVVTCNKSKAWATHLYDSDQQYHAVDITDSYKTSYLLNNSYKISYDSNCSVFFYTAFVSGPLYQAGCSEIFTATDNNGVTYTYCDTYSYTDEDGHTSGVRSDGVDCIIKATSCNCVKGYCNHIYKYTVRDEAGNQTVGQFNYYFMYSDSISLRSKYCNSAGNANKDKYLCTES